MKAATFKSIPTEIIDIDHSKRTVVAYVSKFGNIDLDGDMMMQGCYKKSIQQRGKSGTDELLHLSSHRMLPEYVLSKPDFEEDSFGLKMISTLRNTQHANDILEGYQSGIWNQHSVMFSGVKGKYELKKDLSGQEYVAYYETKLYEGSTVVLGANPETPTVELKSIFKEFYQNDIKKAFEQLNRLQNAYQKGNFTDDFYSLIEIQTKLIESFVEEIITKSIEPQVSIQPQVDNSGYDLVKWFLNKNI